MARIFQSLFVLLASATRQELARQVQFLKAENEILRARLPKRIDVTPKGVSSSRERGQFGGADEATRRGVGRGCGSAVA